MRNQWQPLVVAFCALLASPAWAQQDAVHWHNDLESAKVVAKESGRLVLVHFWTPSCGPCKALERNVFSQPAVAMALETQFVPVKLNADENSATAESFGISRVPTDVVITPNGQVVGKLISPPTPTAYIAELSSLSTRYATQLGAGVCSGGAYGACAVADECRVCEPACSTDDDAGNSVGRCRFCKGSTAARRTGLGCSAGGQHVYKQSQLRRVGADRRGAGRRFAGDSRCPAHESLARFVPSYDAACGHDSAGSISNHADWPTGRRCGAQPNEQSVPCRGHRDVADAVGRGSIDARPTAGHAASRCTVDISVPNRADRDARGAEAAIELARGGGCVAACGCCGRDVDINRSAHGGARPEQAAAGFAATRFRRLLPGKHA